MYYCGKLYARTYRHAGPLTVIPVGKGREFRLRFDIGWDKCLCQRVRKVMLLLLQLHCC